MFTAIWAQDENGLIGENKTMPWHLPNDLKFFKEKTLNHTIVMGRKTFEGMGQRLLPKRQSIILTTDVTYQVPGALVMHSVADVLAYEKEQADTVYIVGGASLYQEFLPYCQRLYKTQIQAKFSGDTYFPPVSWEEFHLVATEVGTVDEKNKYPHVFECYERNR